MANIESFKANLTGGGARANQFEVTMNFPALSIPGQASRKFTYLCKASSLPGSTIGAVEVPYRGRILKIAGDRTFEPWSITIINDTGFEVRNAFEAWSNGINGHNSNTGLSNPTHYQADAIIEQLDKEGNVTKTYDFRGLWPSNIGAIDVSYETADTIQEFTVELQVQYWESTGTTT